MVLYLSIISVAVALISAANIIFGMGYFGYSPWFVIFAVLASTAFQFAIDGLIAWLWSFTPNKWYMPDKKIMQVSDKQIKFYEKMKIRKWKDKVWELGGLGGFSKAKLLEPNSPEYITQFIVESGKGMIEHYIGAFAGFLCIFLFPLKYALVIGVPVAIVNFVLNILPIWILKYNLPKLRVVLRRAERIRQREESEKKAEEEKAELSQDANEEKTETEEKESNN